MQQVLVYSDSLSWGIIPPTRKRLDETFRWPRVMESHFNHRSQRIRVIENCLNGRRTVWEDPFKAGRNGLFGLAQCIEMHSPLALVILLLGTNDFQAGHHTTVWQSAQGIAALLREIRMAEIEPAMPKPEILLLAPPAIQKPAGTMAEKFRGAEINSQGLAHAYGDIAMQYECGFFDVGSVTSSSKMDGIHLDSDQHRLLGKTMAKLLPLYIDKGEQNGSA